MAERNMKVIAQGGVITLDIYLYEYVGGPLKDSDTIPTYVIRDPDGVQVYSGTATRVSLGYYTATYAVDGDAVISSLWKITWTAHINGALVADAEEYFRVVEAGSVYFGNSVMIETEWLNQIKKKLAYPVIPETLLLMDEDLKNLIVKEALHTYFFKFPKTIEEETSINGETVINFPSDLVYGCLDVRVVGKGWKGGSTGSFWDLVAYQSMGYNTTRYGMYGKTGYNPNFLKQTRVLNRMATDTILNEGTFKYRVNQDERKLYAMSTISAKLNITWALYSNDFNDVRPQFKWDVIKIAQALYMTYLADTASIVVDSTAEITIDTASLREQADKIMEAINTKWMDYSDIIIIRD